MGLHRGNQTLEEVMTFALLNQSSVFCDHSDWYCSVLVVLFAVTLPLGVLGNIAALVNYACFRKSPGTSHIFLINLALCDSAWILTLPFSLYFTFQRPWLERMEIFCRFRRVSFSINIYGSILFLTLISFDRFVGTVYPISSLCWWDVGKAKICSVCAWVILVLSSVPDIFLAFAIQRQENITVCMDHIQGPFVFVRTISIIKTTLGFLIPLVLMLTFYVMTMRVLRSLPDRRHRGAQRSRGKPLRLITAALVVFVVSFVPYHIMIITLVLMRSRDQVTPSNSDVLYSTYEFFEALCGVSSCLDPVLYIMASEQFQKRLERVLRRERYNRLCCRATRRVGVIG